MSDGEDARCCCSSHCPFLLTGKSHLGNSALTAASEEAEFTLLICCDVRMGAAEWTEVEGGVTGMFQVTTHLGREETWVVMATQTDTKHHWVRRRNKQYCKHKNRSNCSSIMQSTCHYLLQFICMCICSVYLFPAGGTMAEHSELSDRLFALSEGDCHHQQQVKSKLQAETRKLLLQLRPLQEVLSHTHTHTHTHIHN